MARCVAASGYGSYSGSSCILAPWTYRSQDYNLFNNAEIQRLDMFGNEVCVVNTKFDCRKSTPSLIVGSHP